MVRRLVGGYWWLLLLRDLGSTNGTRVNGQRVRRAALLPKDQLQIASLKYTVEVSVDEPPAAPDESPVFRVP